MTWESIILKWLKNDNVTWITGKFAADTGLDIFLNWLCIGAFVLSCAAALFSAVCVCQVFIKQPKEGVRFPRTHCQLFPISPAPWKRLQEPLSLCGMGAAEEQPVCENGAPVSRAQTALRATNEHPKEPFRIGLHFKPVSSLYINTGGKEREKRGRKWLQLCFWLVTSIVYSAGNILGAGTTLDGEQRWKRKSPKLFWALG